MGRKLGGSCSWWFIVFHYFIGKRNFMEWSRFNHVINRCSSGQQGYDFGTFYWHIGGCRLVYYDVLSHSIVSSLGPLWNEQVD